MSGLGFGVLMAPLPLLSGFDWPVVPAFVAFFVIFFGVGMYLSIKLGWGDRLAEWRARRSPSE